MERLVDLQACAHQGNDEYQFGEVDRHFWIGHWVGGRQPSAEQPKQQHAKQNVNDGIGDLRFL